MPYSSPLFDHTIISILKLAKPRKFFDCGAGAGKYGKIMKEINPLTETIAIETERGYIESFNLHAIYKQVWHLSLTDLIQPRYFNLDFDVVMIGDTIEHLKKSDGIDLLNFLIYRCRWIIIEFPDHYVQNVVDGHASEAHISAWVESDFSSFSEKTKLYKKGTQRLIVLRGYIENTLSIKHMERALKKYARK